MSGNFSDSISDDTGDCDPVFSSDKKCVSLTTQIIRIMYSLIDTGSVPPSPVFHVANINFGGLL